MAEKNSASGKGGRGTGSYARKDAGGRAGRAKSDKLLAEFEDYPDRVDDNEERLHSGKSWDGRPLTDIPHRNLEEITARHREPLLHLPR